MIDETFALAPVGPRARRGGPPVGGGEATAGPELQGALTREVVVALAVARDPGLEARALRVRAMLHRARAEGSLPPPQVAAQVWNLPLVRPYALGEAQMYMLELRQMFPAPGMLDAEARAMAEEARADVAMLSSREREVARRASEAWADYVGATLHHHVHTAHLGITEAMLSAARDRYVARAAQGGMGGGGGAFADVTRLESERARARRALLRYDTELARARETLNALLLRPPGASLGEPSDREALTVPLPLGSLVERAGRARGMIREAQARARAATERTRGARAAATWPEFMASFGYFQDPMMEPGIGLMGAMTLPWVSGGPRARLASAQAGEGAARAEVRAAEVEVRREVATAYAELQGRARELVALRGDELPAALRSVEALRTAYVTGASDLLAWIDAARMVLDVRMMEADLVMELGRAVAMLEEAVGEPLPRAPVTGEEGAR